MEYDKEFAEWWAELVSRGGLDQPSMDIAYQAWKAGWDDGYNAPRWLD